MREEMGKGELQQPKSSPIITRSALLLAQGGRKFSALPTLHGQADN